MASFQDQLQELNNQLENFIAQAKQYFSQLSDLETYGWIGEGVGLVMIIAGIVLFFF